MTIVTKMYSAWFIDVSHEDASTFSAWDSLHDLNSVALITSRFSSVGGTKMMLLARLALIFSKADDALSKAPAIERTL